VLTCICLLLLLPCVLQAGCRPFPTQHHLLLPHICLLSNLLLPSLLLLLPQQLPLLQELLLPCPSPSKCRTVNANTEV
jgi:hypothetical protein